ncbi:hypothetical protein GCM10010231_16830 [Streptomyces sindenensis]|nr:hypothetical protein GCM10010231_16830 [Streptomyces sindenensis]
MRANGPTAEAGTGPGPGSGSEAGSGSGDAGAAGSVPYMVPFVAAGGLLIALSFAIGGYETASARSSPAMDL